MKKYTMKQINLLKSEKVDVVFVDEIGVKFYYVKDRRRGFYLKKKMSKYSNFSYVKLSMV